MNNNFPKYNFKTGGIISIYFILLVVLLAGFSSSLSAQPVVSQLKAGAVRAGQNTQLVLFGNGFSKITKLNYIKIDVFDVLVLDNGIPTKSDKKMKIQVKIPLLIKPGSYPVIISVSGTGFSNWHMESQIGEALDEPEIELFFNDLPIKSGQEAPVYFDSTMVGKPVLHRFKVSNEGNGNLSMDDFIFPDGFSLVGSQPKSISNGNMSFFYVQLDAHFSGNYDGKLEIKNNDKDENPFFIRLKGMVFPPPQPAIAVSIDESLFEDGEDVFIDFGTIAPDSEAVKIITIQNIGDAPLILKDENFANGFSTPDLFPIHLKPGISTSLTIKFAADSSTSYSGIISFNTNIKDRDKFVFQARGQVSISQPVVIEDNNSSPTPPAISVVPENSESEAQTEKTAEAHFTRKTIDVVDVADVVDTEELSWLTIILFITGGVVIISGVLYFLKKLHAGRQGTDGKDFLLSAIHFKTSIDTDFQSNTQNKIAKSSFQFRLQPILDFGNPNIVMSKSSLLSKKMIVIKKPATISLEADAHNNKCDDLTRIEGIGPVISSLLQSSNVTTFEQLANTKIEVLNDILRKAKINIADPTTWSRQAEMASASEWQNLDNLQNKLKGGRIVYKNNN